MKRGSFPGVLAGMTDDIDSVVLAGLVAQVDGPVVTPGDEGYAAETFTWNLGFLQTPAVSVGATSAADVRAAVRFAAAQGLPVAVVATGHGPMSAADGAVLINVRRLTGCVIDGQLRTATVGAATEWQDVVEAAAREGLAPLVGSSPNVGVVGYTIGGGVSPLLGRSYGYASDHVSSVEIVTPDGVLRTAAPDEEPGLFWAVRGGKSNFGVVTSMTFDLMPVTRFYGGGIYFSAEAAPAVLAEFRRLVALDDERLTVSFAFLRLPPLPFVPEPLRGRVTAHVRVAFLGAAAEGADLVAGLRSIGEILVDACAEMPFTAFASVHNDPVDPIPAYERTALLSSFPAQAAEALVEAAGAGVDTPVLMVEVRQLGGALAHEPAVSSAISHRDAPFCLLVATAGGPGEGDLLGAPLEAILQAMKPWDHGGTLVNFQKDSDAAPDRVATAYSPDTYKRLLDAKRQYDPLDLFRVNHTLSV
ncbi:FAD-binding oxidoreductase [Actinoplanes sp. M2I2]|uniref:FAD-binding oxidoreductase n=1 Tax=Actinoplanes sp. M2I2 TaxID=1734444 RepID=UPI00202274DA|nr:FAD-binding oxidoreductase [Actinoplanes sp. M2I2]